MRNIFNTAVLTGAFGAFLFLAFLTIADIILNEAHAAIISPTNGIVNGASVTIQFDNDASQRTDGTKIYYMRTYRSVNNETVIEDIGKIQVNGTPTVANYNVAMPADGTDVFIRLWSLIDENWMESDFIQLRSDPALPAPAVEAALPTVTLVTRNCSFLPGEAGVEFTLSENPNAFKCTAECPVDSVAINATATGQAIFDNGDDGMGVMDSIDFGVRFETPANRITVFELDGPDTIAPLSTYQITMSAYCLRAELQAQ